MTPSFLGPKEKFHVYDIKKTKAEPLIPNTGD